MADIEATSRSLDKAQRNRDSALHSSEVQWNQLAHADLDIESYKLGLARLKGYRDTYFPNWKELTTQD